MLKKTLQAFFFLVLLSVGLPCHAIEWATAYGGKGWDEFRSIQKTMDDGYIVVGETNSFRDGFRDIWVLKLNNTGDVVWDKTIGGSTEQENAKGWSISEITTVGFEGFILAGRINDTGTSSLDGLIVKLDNNGDIIWEQKYGSEKLDLFRDISKTSDDGFIVVGNKRDPVDNDNDFLVMKLDASGNFIWQKTYDTGVPEEGYAVQQTADGGFIVAGRTEPDAFDFRNADAWVLKLKPDGQPTPTDYGVIEWQIKYDNNNGDQIYAIQQTIDDGYIMTGITNSLYRNSPNDDLWVVKLLSNGTIEWEKSYGGDGADMGWDVKETADGGFIVAGATATRCFSVGCTDLWLLKLNDIGTIQWQKSFGGGYCDYAYEIQQTSDNGFIVTGDSASFGSEKNGHDGIILKLDANGDIPGCSAGRDTSAMVLDTAATVVSSTVVVVDAGLSASDPNLVFSTSTAQPREVCFNPYIDAVSPTFESGHRIAGKTINLIGDNFGDIQGDSIVHINGKSFDATSSKVRIWTNKLIKIKTPKYNCDKYNAKGFKNREVWVTVDVVGDSNIVKFKLKQPESCP